MEIRIKNLTKKFFSEGREIVALDEINLTIPANRIFTLLGPSGCGKTTLLRSIVGLETPDSGEIAIGEEIVFSREKDIYVLPEKRGLGMVFQTYAIWPHMDVFNNVAYPLQARKLPKEEIVTKVAAALRFVQLEGFEKRPATKLSGGQQQRVALARALVAEPKVILFDEPLSNLDAKLREETRKELRSFLSRLSITAVYVTHDQIEALSLSDTVAVMKDGRIIELGAPRDIYFNSDKRFVADFIGRANIIEGKVQSVEGKVALVASAIGPITCHFGGEIQAGREVAVCIRPEFINIVGNDRLGTPNVFQGRVEALVFVGSVCEGEIRVGKRLLSFQTKPTARIREGEEIVIHFDPAQSSLLFN